MHILNYKGINTVKYGIVIRTSYPEVPPRVEYSLSPLSQSMRPVIKVMEQWAMNIKKEISNYFPFLYIIDILH